MPEGIRFHSIPPDHKLVKNYIEYYYFFEVSGEQPISYLYYPHYVQVLNIYKDAEVNLTDSGRRVEASIDKTISCTYTCNLHSIRKVSFVGKNNQIGIVFKPLGINHFLPFNLEEVVTEVAQAFDYFGSPFENLAVEVYACTKLKNRRDIFDNYFAAHFRKRIDIDLVKNLHDVLQNKKEFNVNLFAQALGVNRKTVYRQFRKHLCYTPQAFKSVLKFRNALHDHGVLLKSTLTQTAHEHNFYDQSDFIRRYKKLAGLTPRQLINRLDQYGSTNTFWTKL